MTDFRMRLIIETILKDEKLLKQLKKDIDGVGESAKKNSGGLKGFTDKVSSMKGQILAGTAILVGFGLAMKKAFDLSREGAAITQMTASFNLFLDQAGNVPDLLNQLRTAAHGTISDFELMSSTMTLVMGATGDLKLELLEATPQLMEMAKAANKLNPALGSTQFLYESLARGIKRASPLILDNLGVIIKVGEAYQTFADKMGISIKAMTAVQKTQAVLDAALLAGEALIDQVGGTTDSATDSWDRFSASVVNSKNALLSWFADAVQPVVTGLDLLLFGKGRLEDQLDIAINEVTKDSSLAYADYVESVTGMTEATGRAAVSQAELNAMIRDSETGFKTAFNEKHFRVVLTEPMRDGLLAGEEYAQTLARVKKEVLDLSLAIDKQAELDLEIELEKEIQQLEDYKDAVIGASEALVAARTAFASNPFANVSTGILSDITSNIAALDFVAAGGQAVADFEQEVVLSLFDNKITEPQAREMFENLLLSATNVAIELGEVDIGAFAEDLGISIPEATALLADAVPLDELAADLEAMETKTAETVAMLELLGLSAGAAGAIADEAMDALFAGSGETARDVSTTIAEAFGLAEEDVLALGGSFEELTEFAKLTEDQIIEIQTAIDALDGSTATITIVTVGDTPGIDGAHGLNITIPQGFPNDSFHLPLNVQSGEVVTVTPAGKTPPTSASSSGDIHFNAPIYLNSEANQTLEEMVNQAIPRGNI